MTHWKLTYADSKQAHEERIRKIVAELQMKRTLWRTAAEARAALAGRIWKW